MTFLARAATLLAAAILTAPGGVHAQPAPTQPAIAIPDIPYSKFVLKNGLTLLVHEDHKLPVVAVNTWYHVGSKDESPGKTGFAHLFEHLMFSGSENFDKTYLAAMGRVGGTVVNGTTNRDRTNYFQNVPTSMLDYALFAESDRMGHLLGVLDQKKLDLQRGVVQNEKRQGENQPYGVVRQLLSENTYPPGHPYSWTTIGSMKDLDAASMADAREWFRSRYGPNNVTLVLAGDITPEAAREKVEKYYGAIPPGPPIARQQAWIAKRSGTHRGTVEDRVPQARVYRTWNVPGVNMPATPLLDLASHVLGGGKTSRLNQRLVVRDQLATSATVGNNSAELAGQFEMVLTARPGGDLAGLERAAEEELQDLMRSGPTAAELQLAKTAVFAGYARQVERVGGFGGKSDLLASCATYAGNPDCYKDYLQRIAAATPAMVQQAMAQWLSDGDYVLSVKPFAPAPVAAAGAVLDRSKEPAQGAAQPLRLPPLQKAVLANGLKIAVAERHGAPVVNFSLIVDSGFASDPADKPGLASLALRMLDEGTPRRDALRTAQEFEALGANFSTGVNLDGAFVNLNVLKPALQGALPIYADLVMNPAFAQKEFERVRRDRIAAIQREKSDPQSVATRVIPALLYGAGHPYARPMSGLGSEAALARMVREDLAGWHGTWFRPGNATLLVVGDTTLAEVQPLIEAAFAGWQPASVPAKNLPAVAPPAKSAVYLIDRPGAQQSVIWAGQLAPPRNSPEAVQLHIVDTVFGSTFSSRMNMNLREDKHWSYGTRTLLPAAVGPRPYLSRAPVQTDKTREAMQEVLREYRDIAAGARPITQSELTDAQTRETLALPGTFETAGQLSDAYAAILQYKLPENYYENFTPAALAMTLADAQGLASRTFNAGQLVWVVVGDMAKVEQGIRSLGLGEVHPIDGDGNSLR